MFSLTGKLHGVPVDVMWDDGFVDGTPELLDVLFTELEVNPLRSWGAFPGPRWSGRRDVVANPLAFWELALSYLPDAELHDGEAPPMPQVPEGAVA